MASFRQTKTGWRAEVSKLGVRDSQVFKTKANAQAWATYRENQIIEGLSKKKVPNKTFDDLLYKFIKDVTPMRPGGAWEAKRVQHMRKFPIASVKTSALSAKDFAELRDARLKTVAPGTVIREFGILRVICKLAVDEWHWLQHNPMEGVKLPKEPKARVRRISQEEIDLLQFVMCKPGRVGNKVFAAFVFAIETGMRMGEIAALTWADIEGRVADVKDSKTDAGIRKVPLSPKALEVLAGLPQGEKTDLVFGLNTRQLESNFRAYRDKTPIEDLHFHDTRHEAISRMAKMPGMHVLSLARIVGHSDLKELLTYFNPTVDELAGLFTQPPGQ